MRTKLFLMAAAAAVAGVVGFVIPAEAAIYFQGYGGTIQVKLMNHDVGTVYHGLANGPVYGDVFLNTLPTSDPGSGLPWRELCPGADHAAGEDSWGILQVENITGTTSTGQTLVFYDVNNPTLFPTEITAIFWGEHDTSLQQGIFGGRLHQAITGVGMHGAFFEDARANTPYYTGALAGPLARTDVGGMPQFTGVTDGTLLWTINSDDFYTDYQPAYYTSAGTVTGYFGTVPGYGTGPQNGQFSDPYVSMNFSGNPEDPAFSNAGWLIKSNDPLLATVPEPASLGLLVLGLAGLLGTRGARRTR